ncbi:hypothetical protein BGZ65_003915 [Modicella reniformis]|uniref:Acyl-protein thioesterase 1 n=1 Tax=Modicella reniformis TaxID=1440133 RepID=A0A9P6IZH3_9FUNG|nr:hypothetical protein BGZ65_003915 [Modicella reniformis]
MSAALVKLTAIVQEAAAKHTATVIILHGFGDSGAGWQVSPSAPVGEQPRTSLPHVKFVFPNASARPITSMGGMLVPAWYDIPPMVGERRQQDEQGLLLAGHQVMQLVREEVDQHGIHANRIVIGGFSQGCALGLFTGLTSEYKLAGIVALSGYLPIDNKIMTMVADANRKTPIFWGHGDDDQVVKYEHGEQSVKFLQEQKYPVEFHTYPRMAHSACLQEIKDIQSFLNKTLPKEMPILAKS